MYWDTKRIFLNKVILHNYVIMFLFILRMSSEFASPVVNRIFTSERIIGSSIRTLEALLSYPLEDVVSHPLDFFTQVQQMYSREKKRAISGQQLPAGMDLASVVDLKRMDSHTKVHVVTGIVEWGGSTTESIPYWDRQALFEGFRHVYPNSYEGLALQSDIETINGLRSVIGIIAPRYLESSSAIGVIRSKIDRGNVTRSSIVETLEKKRRAWDEINRDYHRVLVGKIKHLVYIADKLPDQDARGFVLNEVCSAWQSTGIDNFELTINLGIDGGLSEATYRPPYYIVGIKQLEHLGLETVAIPQEVCPDWSLEQWTASLMRPNNTPSLLIEPNEYKLDWRFE